jgi:hypothetical protein
MSDEDNIEMSRREKRRRRRQEREKEVGEEAVSDDNDVAEDVVDEEEDTEYNGGANGENDALVGKQRKRRQRVELNDGNEKTTKAVGNRTKLRNSHSDEKFKLWKRVLGVLTMLILIVGALGFEICCMFGRLCRNYEDPAVPNEGASMPTDSFIPLMVVSCIMGVLAYATSLSESALKLMIYSICSFAFAIVLLVFGIVLENLGDDVIPNPEYPKSGGSEYYTTAEGIAQKKWKTLPVAMVSNYYPTPDDVKTKFISNAKLMAGFEIYLSVIIIASAVASVVYAIAVRNDTTNMINRDGA